MEPFTNLDQANAWIAKAAVELAAHRRDFMALNQMLYALGQHGYELNIKDTNELLGDRERYDIDPRPEDNVIVDTTAKMRGLLRAHLDLADTLAALAARKE